MPPEQMPYADRFLLIGAHPPALATLGAANLYSKRLGVISGGEPPGFWAICPVKAR